MARPNRKATLRRTAAGAIRASRHQQQSRHAHDPCGGLWNRRVIRGAIGRGWTDPNFERNAAVLGETSYKTFALPGIGSRRTRQRAKQL